MFRKTFNIILASLMVLLTTGVSVTQHFCHDRLQTTSILSLAANCGEAKGCCVKIEKSCCSNKAVQIQKENCCKNESVFVKFYSQFTINKSERATVFVPQATLTATISVASFSIVPRVFASLKHPPPISEDIRILFSSFQL